MDPFAILSHNTKDTADYKDPYKFLLRCHSLYIKLALGTYLVGSMNLDNGPNFALAYLVPVYSLDFESAKSQGNAIFVTFPACFSKS